MVGMADELEIRRKFEALSGVMDERVRRLWAGVEATVVQLIGNVRTSSGLTVRAQLDTRSYQTGIPIADAQMEQLNLVPECFHGDWNYTIKPNRKHNG
jgi:Rhodopirellula transposase.